MRIYLGRLWTPEVVKLQSTITDGCDKASCLVGSQLYISQSFTGIAIPKVLLNENQKKPSDYLLSKKQKNIPLSNAEKISQLFEQNYFGDVPTIEKVAKYLQLHPRALQRLLKKECVDFRTLLNTEKFKRAKSLLLYSTISLTEVSLELGFTHPANFTRAFKRWSEMSPQAYRAKLSEKL